MDIRNVKFFRYLMLFLLLFNIMLQFLNNYKSLVTKYVLHVVLRGMNILIFLLVVKIVDYLVFFKCFCLFGYFAKHQ